MYILRASTVASSCPRPCPPSLAASFPTAAQALPHRIRQRTSIHARTPRPSPWDPAAHATRRPRRPGSDGAHAAPPTLFLPAVHALPHRSATPFPLAVHARPHRSPLAPTSPPPAHAHDCLQKYRPRDTSSYSRSPRPPPPSLSRSSPRHQLHGRTSTTSHPHDSPSPPRRQTRPPPPHELAGGRHQPLGSGLTTHRPPPSPARVRHTSPPKTLAPSP
jgi:hypothetical protein